MIVMAYIDRWPVFSCIKVDWEVAISYSAGNKGKPICKTKF